MTENQRPDNLTHEAALSRLKAGNARASSDASEHPRSDAARRAELVGGQRPFVTVLACADSRVSPELVFDEGLGDLFVIRVAGNIIDDAILGSIEYAGLHLGVNLVVVMGTPELRRRHRGGGQRRRRGPRDPLPCRLADRRDPSRGPERRRRRGGCEHPSQRPTGRGGHRKLRARLGRSGSEWNALRPGLLQPGDRRGPLALIGRGGVRRRLGAEQSTGVQTP